MCIRDSIMGERPMTIRYLDPPLHEFLPTKDEDIKELAADMGMTFEDLKNVVASLHEFNPMMGHRGCRLAVTYPEIAAMPVSYTHLPPDCGAHTRRQTAGPPALRGCTPCRA